MAKQNMNPKSLENLKPPFSKENQPAGRGRKKSRVKEFTKDFELTYDEISQLAKYALSMTEKELREEAINKEAPMILRLFCRFLMEDLKKGVATNIHVLMDRAVGRVKQDVDVGGSVTLRFDKDDEAL